jgi:hypothetical protein
MPIYADDLAWQKAQQPATPYSGSLEAAPIAAIMQGHAAEFRACGLRGTAVVRAIVDSEGKVTSASFFREHLSGGDKVCLLRTISSVPFPPPRMPAEVILPLVFR